MSKHHKIDLSKFNFKTSDIKTEILKVDGDFIHSRFIYPNGLILEFKQTPEEIEVISNKTIIQNPDGSYEPVMD